MVSLKFTYLAFLLVSCLPDRFKLAVPISFLDGKHWEGFILLFLGGGGGPGEKLHELRMMQENTWKRLLHCMCPSEDTAFIHLFIMWRGHLLWLGALSDARGTDEKKVDKVLAFRMLASVGRGSQSAESQDSCGESRAFFICNFIEKWLTSITI